MMKQHIRAPFLGFLPLLLMLLFCLSAQGQRPAYAKMSALVRQACNEEQSVPRGQRAPLRQGPADGRMLTAFVKLSNTDTTPLTRRGCTVLAQRGSLCIASIPLPAIAPLSLDSHVSRIEAGRRATALMDTTGIIVGATPVQQGINLPQGYTGAGVVVGVQDIGFDLTHPTFWSADMSTYRIKALWDQLSDDTLQSTLPAGRDYVGQDALLAISHPRDGLQQTHGTHTTGIAAGSGAEGDGHVSPYRGIAYDADICLVCNATSDDINLISPRDYYKYTYALDALGFKYIFDYADRVGKPCVINFSEGSPMDFRGDDQLYYEMLDSLTGPGHIIVSAAGNNALQLTYFRKAADVGSDTINCYKSGNTPSFTVTTRSQDDFTFSTILTHAADTLSLNVPLSEVLSSADSVFTDSIVNGDLRYIVTARAYTSCFNSQDIICDWTVLRNLRYQGDANWRLRFGLQGDGQVEMFPVSALLYHDDWVVRPGENIYSVYSPGTAPSVISVGSTDYRQTFINYLGETFTLPMAFHKGRLSSFSGLGPTFDERVKPDVVAPGVDIISAYSSFYEAGHNVPSNVKLFNYGGREYVWNADTGTSMASPVVAGVIALWLQANPRLTPADCLDIIARTSTHLDPALSYPNTSYGYGQIDAEAGLRLILERQATGIRETTGRPAADGRIYTIDGRYAGRDAQHLPAGLYLRDGKKFIVNH